jgi:hypothetical protein
VCVGDWGGEVGGEGLFVAETGVVSTLLFVTLLSVDASARSRDNEDRPAFGLEFDRERTGKRCDVGECVTWKESSTSASGGPGGRFGGGVVESFAPFSAGTFLEETLRLFC